MASDNGKIDITVGVFTTFSRFKLLMESTEDSISKLLEESRIANTSIRDLNTVAAGLMEELRDLKRRTREFFNHFFYCRYDIRDLDSRRMEEAIRELGENNLKLFFRGIKIFLKEVEELDTKVRSDLVKLKNLAGILDFRRRIAAIEENLQKTMEILQSFQNKSEMERLRSESETFVAPLENIKHRFQEFAEEVLRSCNQNLDPSVVEKFRRQISDFKNELNNIDVMISVKLMDVEVSLELESESKAVNAEQKQPQAAEPQESRSLIEAGIEALRRIKALDSWEFNHPRELSVEKLRQLQAPLIAKVKQRMEQKENPTPAPAVESNAGADGLNQMRIMEGNKNVVEKRKREDEPNGNVVKGRGKKQQ